MTGFIDTEYVEAIRARRKAILEDAKLNANGLGAKIFTHFYKVVTTTGDLQSVLPEYVMEKESDLGIPEGVDFVPGIGPAVQCIKHNKSEDYYYLRMKNRAVISNARDSTAEEILLKKHEYLVTVDMMVEIRRQGGVLEFKDLSTAVEVERLICDYLNEVESRTLSSMGVRRPPQRDLDDLNSLRESLIPYLDKYYQATKRPLNVSQKLMRSMSPGASLLKSSGTSVEQEVHIPDLLSDKGMSKKKNPFDAII